MESVRKRFITLLFFFALFIQAAAEKSPNSFRMLLSDIDKYSFSVVLDPGMTTGYLAPGWLDRLIGTGKLRSYTPASGSNASSRRIFVGQILGLNVRHDLDIEPATRGVSSLPGNVCLTCSGGLLIGYKVARQFESHSLHHPVPQVSDLSDNRSKSAHSSR
jgi:hypothetical protein